MKTKETIIFEALGEASMCWNPLPSNQVFDSIRAKEIGNRVIKELASLPSIAEAGEKINVQEFVEKWIASHEPDTFIKSKEKTKGYWYTSEDGVSSINLGVFFEDLLEDFIASLPPQAREGVKEKEIDKEDAEALTRLNEIWGDDKDGKYKELYERHKPNLDDPTREEELTHALKNIQLLCDSTNSTHLAIFKVTKEALDGLPNSDVPVSSELSNLDDKKILVHFTVLKKPPNVI